jgi:hypothetical protein
VNRLERWIFGVLGSGFILGALALTVIVTVRR